MLETADWSLLYRGRRITGSAVRLRRVRVGESCPSAHGTAKNTKTTLKLVSSLFVPLLQITFLFNGAK